MLMVTARSIVNQGGLPGAFAALRAIGVPVGMGAARRPNLAARLQGVGAVVQHNFFGVMVPYADANDVMQQTEQSWETARGNGTGYACMDLQLDPALAAGRLIEMANDQCGLAPEACVGINVPASASALAAKYAAWFAATFPKGPGDCYNYDAATWAAKFPGANQQQYWTQGPPGGSTSVAATAPPPYVAPAPYVQPAAPLPSPTPSGGGAPTAYSVPTGYVAPNTPAPTVAPTPTAPAPSAGSTGGGGATSTGLPTAAAPAPVALPTSLPSWALPAAAAFALVLLLRK